MYNTDNSRGRGRVEPSAREKSVWSLGRAGRTQQRISCGSCRSIVCTAVDTGARSTASWERAMLVALRAQMARSLWVRRHEGQTRAESVYTCVCVCVCVGVAAPLRTRPAGALDDCPRPPRQNPLAAMLSDPLSASSKKFFEINVSRTQNTSKNSLNVLSARAVTTSTTTRITHRLGDLKGQKSRSHNITSAVWRVFAHNSTKKSRRSTEIGKTVACATGDIPSQFLGQKIKD